MEQYSLAQEFVNLMAKALQILVSVSREDLYTLNAMKDYSAIGNDVKQKIDTPTIESAQQLLERIRSILSITVFDKGIIINHNKNRANLH